MRTTLVLDDDLIRQAKQRAAALDLTLGQLVERALRDLLRAAAPQHLQPFRMVTYGGGSPVRHEPSDFKDVIEQEDAARP